MGCGVEEEEQGAGGVMRGPVPMRPGTAQRRGGIGTGYLNRGDGSGSGDCGVLLLCDNCSSFSRLSLYMVRAVGYAVSFSNPWVKSQLKSTGIYSDVFRSLISSP